MSGWVKLNRKLLDWEWKTHPPTCHLFIHLLLIANFKETKWRGEIIKPGQILTGRKKLSEDTGLSERQVRTAINNLKKTGEVTSTSTSKYSIITITQWDLYQMTDWEATSKVPTNDQQTTTSNKDNNITTVATRARVGEKISKITGWDKDPNWFGDFSRIEAWLKAGWCPEKDIYPTVRRLMGKRRDPPRGLKYFEQAIADAHAQRNKPLPEGVTNNGTGNRKTKSERLDDSVQRVLAEFDDRDEIQAQSDSQDDPAAIRHSGHLRHDPRAIGQQTTGDD